MQGTSINDPSRTTTRQASYQPVEKQPSLDQTEISGPRFLNPSAVCGDTDIFARAFFGRRLSSDTPGQNGHIHPGGSRIQQGTGTTIRCDAGRQDIIRKQDPLPRHIPGSAHSKCPFQI